MPRPAKTPETFTHTDLAKLLKCFPKSTPARLLGDSIGTPYIHPKALQEAINQAPEQLLGWLEALQRDMVAGEEGEHA